MTALPDGARVCARTGLVLVPANGETGWRLSKTSYGPLNPPARPADPDADPAGWGRFDVRGGRTLYLAATRECAFAEVLAHQRRKLGERDSLTTDAAFLGVGVADLVAAVEQEWHERGHLPPGHIGKGWRTERAMYEIALPTTGWWCCSSILTRSPPRKQQWKINSRRVGVGELDVAVLRGPNRDATVLLATWASTTLLDDGGRPHGIRFNSRHATGVAWAYWMREPDAGPTLEVVRAKTTIDETDEDLARVAARHGCHDLVSPHAALA